MLQSSQEGKGFPLIPFTKEFGGGGKYKRKHGGAISRTTADTRGILQFVTLRGKGEGEKKRTMTSYVQ